MLVASDCMILFLTTSENALEKLLTQISGRKILVRKFIFGIGMLIVCWLELEMKTETLALESEII